MFFVHFSGNFAVVRRVIKKADEKEFAAKIISKRNLKQEELDTLNDEVNIMYKVGKKNSKKFFFVFFSNQYCFDFFETGEFEGIFFCVFWSWLVEIWTIFF